MIRYFDTSVLLAAILKDQPKHQACLDLVTSNGATNCIIAHGLAECFSILTGGRLSTQIDANTAAAVIEQNIAQRFKIITLTAEETIETLKQAQPRGIRGGAIYDALHLAGARSVGADEIYTLNLRHFQRFAPDMIDQIIEP